MIKFLKKLFGVYKPEEKAAETAAPYKVEAPVVQDVPVVTNSNPTDNVPVKTLPTTPVSGKIADINANILGVKTKKPRKPAKPKAEKAPKVAKPKKPKKTKAAE